MIREGLFSRLISCIPKPVIFKRRPHPTFVLLKKCSIYAASAGETGAARKYARTAKASASKLRSPATKFKPTVYGEAVVASEKGEKGRTEMGRRMRVKVIVSANDIYSAQAS